MPAYIKLGSTSKDFKDQSAANNANALFEWVFLLVMYVILNTKLDLYATFSL